MKETIIKIILVVVLSMIFTLIAKWCGNYDSMIICILVNMFVYIVWRDYFDK